MEVDILHLILNSR